MINLLTPDFPDRLFHPGYCPFYLIKDCNYWYIMIIQWLVLNMKFFLYCISCGVIMLKFDIMVKLP